MSIMALLIRGNDAARTRPTGRSAGLGQPGVEIASNGRREETAHEIFPSFGEAASTDVFEREFIGGGVVAEPASPKAIAENR